MRVQTMVLIGAAALALIVVFRSGDRDFVTGKAEHNSVAAPLVAAAVTTPAPLRVTAPEPVIAIPPVLKASAPTTPAPAPSSLLRPPLRLLLLVCAKPVHPHLISAPVVVPTVTPAPASAVLAASTPAPPAAESRTDMIQGIIDKYRVSGVRAKRARIARHWWMATSTG